MMSNNRRRSEAPPREGDPASAQGHGSTATLPPAPTQKSNTSQNRSAANQRFAERQAAKQRAARDAHRGRNRAYGIAVISLVVVIVAVLVLVKVTGGGSGGAVDVPSPPAGTPIPAATLTKLASVPVSTLNAAPTDGLLNTPQPINGTALIANGKSELLFIGAEFCPHCAAERWPVYIALSKFGTFSPEPGRIHSATLDGNVPTLTFYGTTYSSPYLTFTPVEVYTNRPSGNGYATLQVPTQAQYDLWQHIGGGTFPFLDFGGKRAMAGAQYSFGPLQNLPFSAVAAQVGNNSTVIGADIDSSASQLIKTICGSLTHGQPANVCSSTKNG
jgi:Domain of unknown function (DUF929)